MDDATRTCAKCGQTKPVAQFDPRFIHKQTRLTCAQYRGAQRQAEEEARRREAQQRQAARRKAYEAWAEPLRALGFMESELDTIHFLEARLFRRRETWEHIKAQFYCLNPAYIPIADRKKRRTWGTTVRSTIFERQRGLCYYCQTPLHPVGEADYALLEARYKAAYQQYRKRLHAFNAWERAQERWRAETLRERCGLWQERDRLRDDLKASEAGQQYEALSHQRHTYRQHLAHIEHRIPIARGGADVLENLVLACAPCNMQKWVRTAEEFAMMPHDPISELQEVGLLLIIEGIGYEARGYRVPQEDLTAPLPHPFLRQLENDEDPS